MRSALLLGLCLLSAAVRAERAAVAKEDVAGKIFVHCNPWFPIDVVGVHSPGGPDVPWEHYRGTNSWGRCMEVLQSYGVDGIMLEINEPTASIPVFRKLLDSAPDGFQLMMHFAFISKKVEDTVRNVRSVLAPYMRDLAESPHVLRIGGRPVMFLYSIRSKPLSYYKDAFEGIDREVCPMTYLFCYSDLWMKSGWDAGKFETLVRDALAVFDGASTYSFSYEGIGVQRTMAGVLSRVMREHPGKVFFGGAFTTWTQPFVQAGLEVHLSRDWRASVDLWMDRSTGADAIELTNLFDHYEQSLVYPSYEREDLLLRYLQYAASRWRGSAFKKEKEPELVLCSQVCAQIGWTELEYEVLGFPVDAAAKGVQVGVEVCDTSGKVLRRLGPTPLDLSSFAEAHFSLPSIDFASERGLVPRLFYIWNGTERRMPFSPMTLLSPSARNYRMYWARSTRNAYELYMHDGDTEDWTLDGVHPGGTRHPTPDGQGVFASRLHFHDQDHPRRGFGRAGIRRDGLEYEFGNARGLDVMRAVTLPPPGKALHWYGIEIENKGGRRWGSLPVWETDGSRDRIVRMPVQNGSNGVVECAIEECRVPFYHWPCRRDGGKYLLDESGYMHNGCVNPVGRWAWDEINYVGYNLYHNSPISWNARHRSTFVVDGDGKGALEFGGGDYVIVKGGTAFPGASTYEISVKPAAIGERMGLLNTDIGHVLLSILPDGRVRAARRASPPEGADQFAYRWPEVLSTRRLEAGRWAHIAYVYDLKTIRLYVDGKLQGEAPSPACYADLGWESSANPNTSHECRNMLMIGAETDGTDSCAPMNRFKGRIREIRAYGRNLSPSEFLHPAQ